MAEYKNSLTLLLLALLLSSCGGLVNRIAVKSTGGILSQASEEVLQEGNWDIFYYGVPGNLKLMEGLYHIVPDDRKVLSSLIKGYAGYAFVVNETLALDEEYNEFDVRPNSQQAIINYSKAVTYGEEFLNTYGLSYNKLLKSISLKGGVTNLLRQMGTSKFELETLFFVAQAYGGLILFNRDDMSLISKRPMVKAIFDYVCELRPNINDGACSVFYAANLVLTPKMMGGDPVEGKKIFQDAMAKFPGNYFIRVAYLQFYIIPFEEEDLFEKNVALLEAEEKKFKNSLKFNPSNESNKRTSVKLFQSVAFKRLEIIKKHKGNFF